MSREIQFRENLRALVKTSGLNQKEVAMRLELPWNWFRKACSDGIARETQSNRERLRAVAKFFSLPRTRLLWSPNLITKQLFESPDPAELEHHFQMLQQICAMDPSKGVKLLQRIAKTWETTDAAFVEKTQAAMTRWSERDDFEAQLSAQEYTSTTGDLEPVVESDEVAEGIESPFDNIVPPPEWENSKLKNVHIEHLSGDVDDTDESFQPCNACYRPTEARELDEHRGYCEECSGSITNSARKRAEW